MSDALPPPPPGGWTIYGGKGPTALGVSWSLFILATILMGMRYYVRYGMNRPAKWPMFWLTFAYIGGVIAQICVTIDTVKYGMGNHIWILIETGAVVDCVLWVWITLFFALVCIGVGKAAAASLLISIQGQTRPMARYFLCGLAGLNVLMDGVVMIALWFQCDPVQKLWDTQLPGTCSNVRPIEYLGIAAGSVNAVSDLIFALYPTYMVFELNMPKRIKIGVAALMGLGVFSGISAAIKTSELRKMEDTMDPTYAIASLVIWGLAEQWIIVIVAAIPPTWPLIQALIQGRSPSAITASTGGTHSKPVYLSGRNDDYGNLRGGDTKTLKSKGYVDHTAISLPNEGSTADLPGNIIMMRHEISVQHDNASVAERGYSTNVKAYSNSRGSSSDEVSES